MNLAFFSLYPPCAPAYFLWSKTSKFCVKETWAKHGLNICKLTCCSMTSRFHSALSHLPLTVLHITSPPRLRLLRGPFAGSDTDMWVGEPLIQRNHQTLLLVPNLPRRDGQEGQMCPRRETRNGQEKRQGEGKERASAPTSLRGELGVEETGTL